MSGASNLSVSESPVRAHATARNCIPKRGMDYKTLKLVPIKREKGPGKSTPPNAVYDGPRMARFFAGKAGGVIADIE